MTRRAPDTFSSPAQQRHESVHQFNREYGRLFGLPPGHDIKASRQRAA